MCASNQRRNSQGWASAFTAALAGVAYALRTQRNMRVHFAASVAAVGLSWLCGLTRGEFCCVLLCLGLVWAAELMNTAVEAVVDLLSPEHHAAAKAAKDCAAGAVLAASVAALIVGAVLFLEPLLRLAGLTGDRPG